MALKSIRFLKVKLFGILALTGLISGCTLSSLFGDGKDQAVLKQRQYRKINRACAGMDLSSSEMSVQTFRSLISCLNSNGALRRTEDLVHLLHDDEVEAVTHFLNRSVLNNNRRLFQIEQTFRTWSQTSLQDEAFGILADVLDHRELLSSFLHLVKAGYYLPSSNPNEPVQADEKILAAMSLLARNFDPDALRQALDLGLTTTRSAAFRSLKDHLLAPRSFLETTETRDQKNLELVTHLLDYLKEDHTFSCDGRNEKMIREVYGLARSNQIFPVLDLVLGGNEDEVLGKLPVVNRLVNGLLGRSSDGILFDQLAYSFRALGVDQAGPLACMKGAKAIPDATRYLIREMAEFRTPAAAEHYLSYEAPLTLMTLGPFCQFPKGLNQYYAPLHQLVDSGVTESMVDLLQTLYRVQTAAGSGAVCTSRSSYPGEPSRPWIDLVMHVFADGGPNGQGGVHHLTPVLLDAVSRGLLPDALLLSTVYHDDQRVQLNAVLAFLTEDREELDHHSILEVFNGAASRAHPGELYRFLKSSADLLSANDGQFLQHVLETGRRLHFVNDTHPFLDLIRESGMEANTPQNRKLFEALFALVEHHEDALLDGLEEWSNLARDGELKVLVESLIQLFHQFAQRGVSEIREMAEPPFADKARHALAQVPTRDLPGPERSGARAKYASCRRLNLEFSLADVKDSRFSQELEQFLACKKSSGDSFDLDLSEALGSLNGPSSRGDSFLSYQLGALQQTLGGFEKSQIEYLVNGWMRDFQFTGGATVDPQAEQSQMRGNLWVKGIRALPYWIVPEAPVFGSSGLTSDIREAPLKSLMHGLRPLVTQSDHLRDFESLQDLGARVLEKDLFPKLLSDAEVLFTRTQEIREQQSYPEYQERELANQKAALGKIYTPELREVLKYWVRSVECWRGSGLNVEKRVDEIIHESQNRVTTYELIDTPEGPKAPLAWNFNSLKNQAKPILDRLRDERLSNSEHLLLDSTFKFFQSATGAASSESGAFSPYKRGNFWVRYSPEKLLELFHKRARRVSPRIQYYKGHPNPYVVLDSDLDLMEKALGNVDMRLDAPPGKNIAFQFSEELAHAWGDLPAAEWPDEIAKKYSVAFHIAQSQGFTDPSAWGEASRKSYEHSRPRTLGEAVDGIINRPPNFGHSFDPVTIAFEIGVYKAGIPVPEFKKNFSQDHGLEDLKILTQEAAGLPALPQCVRDHQEFFFSPEFNTEMVRVVHLPPGLNRPGFHQPPFPRKSDGHVAIKGGLTVLKGPTEFANMQGMLFNLWQSIDVLKQNVPGAPENDDGGLLPVMRDLFFEVFYSNTKEVLDKEFPSTEIDKNQLRLVSQFLRLGVMHQLGMQLQKFELNDPALKAVFHSVLRGASSPEMLQLTRYLLHKDPEDRLIWNVVQGISNAKSSQVDELKRLSFYLLAGLDQIDPWAGPQRDSRDLGVAVQALARSHELMDSFYNWFVKIGAAHSGRDISSLIEKVVDSRWGSSSAEALYEMLNQATESSGTPERWRELILEALREAQPGATRSDLCATVSLAKATWEDSHACQSLDELVKGIQRVQDLREYQDLGVADAIRPLLDFIEEKEDTPSVNFALSNAGIPGAGARQVGAPSRGGFRVAAARELRQNLANFLRYRQGSRSNGLNELILYAHENPEGFDRLLSVLGQSIQRGQVTDFLKLIRRSLPESRD